MAAREIPGFYYDVEKKKYFAIGQSHNLPPDAKYSMNNIETERRQAKRQKLESDHEDRRNRGRIKRSAILEAPLAGSIGMRRDQGAFSRQGYMHQLNTAFAAGLELSTEKLKVLPPRRREGIGNKISIKTFVHDSHTGTFFADIGQPRHGVPRGVMIMCVPKSGGLAWEEVNQRNVYCLARQSHDISSISLNPVARTLLMTTYGSAGIFPLRKEKVSPMDAWRESFPLWHCRLPQVLEIPPTTFSSAASTETKAFAVGKCGRVEVYDVKETRYVQTAIFDESPVKRDSRATRDRVTDYLAVEWLTPSLLLGGCRNGKISLFDVRSDDHIDIRFRHSSLVADMRRVDANQFIVAGFEDTLDMYDIRYPHNPKDGSDNAPSMPLLSFAHHNRATQGLGFDVHASLGLLIAATDDKMVRMFDLRTGRTLDNAMTRHRATENVTCIRFAPDEDSGNGPMVLMSIGNEFCRWKW